MRTGTGTGRAGTSSSETLVPRVQRSGGFQPVASRRTLLGSSTSSSARQGVFVLSDFLSGQARSGRQGTLRDDERWCSARDEYTHDDDHPGWF